MFVYNDRFITLFIVIVMRVTTNCYIYRFNRLMILGLGCIYCHFILVSI